MSYFSSLQVPYSFPIWSALLFMFSVTFFISFIEFFSSRTSFGSIYNFSFFDKELLVFINFISNFIELFFWVFLEFNFFLRAILNSLSVRLKYSAPLTSVAGKLTFSFVTPCLLDYFIMLDDICFFFPTFEAEVTFLC